MKKIKLITITGLVIINVLLVFLIISFPSLKETIIRFFILNNKEWENYRLGDIIGFNGKDGLVFNSDPFLILKNMKNYKKTIAWEYITNTNKNKDYDTLLKIIDRRSKSRHKSNDNDIILHLRVGDAIIGYENGKFIAFESAYLTPLENIENNINIFKDKRAILVYGSHNNNGGGDDLSLKYIQEVKNILNKHKIPFIDRKSGNPDEDFLYMCNAKHFVKSGGGFSHIISEIVKLKNNKVYEIM